MAHSALYLGLISGTSVDGVDAALLRFSPRLEVVRAATMPYPAPLRERLLKLAAARVALSLDELGTLDVAVGEHFAVAALDLLHQAGVAPTAVAAIGSHGQTARHAPTGRHPFTLQIGDPTVIAERTGILTVADFRRADIAAGGQGAPLMPAFHAAMLGPEQGTRSVLNLGGIANLTVLHADGTVLGFDTGPANCLLDAWASRHRHKPRDEGGTWARSGHVDSELLAHWLADPYFALPAPKSTGREYFNIDWMNAHVATAQEAADVQATLLELTVRSVADAQRAYAPDALEMLVCGGGVHNSALMQALRGALAPLIVRSTAALGLDPDHVEAAGFAWLARERLEGRPGNLPSVTGARGPRLLGAVYPAG